MDRFIEFADLIEDAYPDLLVDGNPDDIEPREGAFEVTLGEDITLFSKLKEMRHPDHDEVLKSLAQGLEVVEEGTG